MSEREGRAREGRARERGRVREREREGERERERGRERDFMDFNVPSPHRVALRKGKNRF